jgi:hypothetical protein
MRPHSQRMDAVTVCENCQTIVDHVAFYAFQES